MIALSPLTIMFKSWSHFLSTCLWTLTLTPQKVNKISSVQQVSWPLWRLRFMLKHSPAITNSRAFSITACHTTNLCRSRRVSAMTATWKKNSAALQIAPLMTHTLKKLWWAFQNCFMTKYLFWDHNLRTMWRCEDVFFFTQFCVMYCVFQKYRVPTTLGAQDFTQEHQGL